MKLNEVGFRAVYKNYVVYSLNEKFRECMKDYPGIDEANCMLLYGYIWIMGKKIRNQGRFPWN